MPAPQKEITLSFIEIEQLVTTLRAARVHTPFEDDAHLETFDKLIEALVVSETIHLDDYEA